MLVVYLSLPVAMQTGRFYMYYLHSHDFIPILIPISSPKASPVHMRFRWESHSHENPIPMHISNSYILINVGDAWWDDSTWV